MSTNEHTKILELLEAVFSVVHDAIFAGQRRGKHASATIEEICFKWSMPRSYPEDNWRD
jgi:hypothetical protein